MAFELLVAEASDLSEDSIMEVVRYISENKGKGSVYRWGYV